MGTLFTPELADKLLDLTTKESITVACMACGIDKSTYFRWIHKAEEEPESSQAHYQFDRRAREARSEYAKRLITYIRASATPLLNPDGSLKERGEWKAAAWILERDFPEYQPQTKTDINLSGQVDITAQIDITSERAAEIHERMLARKKNDK